MSRKLGGAVRRNRIKRIIREIVRLRDVKNKDGMGLNMVVVARGGMIGVNFKEADEAFGHLIGHLEY